MHKIIRNSLLLCVLVSVISCGGGKSSDTTTIPPVQPPPVDYSNVKMTFDKYGYQDVLDFSLGNTEKISQLYDFIYTELTGNLAQILTGSSHINCSEQGSADISWIDEDQNNKISQNDYIDIEFNSCKPSSYNLIFEGSAKIKVDTKSTTLLKSTLFINTNYSNGYNDSGEISGSLFVNYSASQHTESLQILSTEEEFKISLNGKTDIYNNFSFSKSVQEDFNYLFDFNFNVISDSLKGTLACRTLRVSKGILYSPPHTFEMSCEGDQEGNLNILAIAHGSEDTYRDSFNDSIMKYTTSDGSIINDGINLDKYFTGKIGQSLQKFKYVTPDQKILSLDLDGDLNYIKDFVFSSDGKTGYFYGYNSDKKIFVGKLDIETLQTSDLTYITIPNSSSSTESLIFDWKLTRDEKSLRLLISGEIFYPTIYSIDTKTMDLSVFSEFYVFDQSEKNGTNQYTPITFLTGPNDGYIISVLNVSPGIEPSVFIFDKNGNWNTFNVNSNNPIMYYDPNTLGLIIEEYSPTGPSRIYRTYSISNMTATVENTYVPEDIAGWGRIVFNVGQMVYTNYGQKVNLVTGERLYEIGRHGLTYLPDFNLIVGVKGTPVIYDLETGNQLSKMFTGDMNELKFSMSDPNGWTVGHAYAISLHKEAFDDYVLYRIPLQMAF